jgi:hypothetical protein
VLPTENSGEPEMKGSHYTIDSPAVREILTGVYRNANRNYFRIAPDGRCDVFAVRTHLMALGMGSTSASKILEQANIPAGTFVLNPSVKLDQGRWVDGPCPTIVGQDSIEHDDDMPVCELRSHSEVTIDPSVTDDLIPQSKPVKKSGPKSLTEEEREEKLARQDEAANSKRYQYIETSSGKFGIWDGANGYTVFLAYTEEEAIEEMSRLQTGKSCVVTSTGGSGTRHRE